MAKDPAFLFYYADAASDVSLMNRLERGCYFDIMQAQKKFGRLNIIQIKKILGSDFDSCWPSIEMIMTKIDDLYYIEWLEDSIEKRKKFTESRKKNRESAKSEKSEEIVKSYDEDMINICSTYEEHMVNENVNVIVNKNENKNFGKSENLLHVDPDSGLWQDEKNRFLNDFRWREKFCRDKAVEQLELENWMNEFLADLELKEQVKPLKELKNHFTNWFNKNKKNAQRTGENSRKPGTSEARTEALGRWKIPEGIIQR